MSLDKAIRHGKEHRKDYRGAAAIDRSCRNHGSCPYCKRNRALDRYEYWSRYDILNYMKGETYGEGQDRIT
jgi:hypothetical protein